MKVNLSVGGIILEFKLRLNSLGVHEGAGHLFLLLGLFFIILFYYIKASGSPKPYGEK